MEKVLGKDVVGGSEAEEEKFDLEQMPGCAPNKWGMEGSMVEIVTRDSALDWWEALRVNGDDVIVDPNGVPSMVLVQTDDVHIEHVIYYLSRQLVGAKLKYPYVEKLALAAAFAVQKFHHYLILRTTTVISDANPMKYILSRQVLGVRYSKWIVILSEFDLVFSTPKAKKSLVFAELMARLPQVSYPIPDLDSLPDDSLFLIDSSDPWYGEILVYLQT